MRDDKSRCHFGVANGEQDFAFYPDVIRIVEWIERHSAMETEHAARPTLRKAVAGAADLIEGTSADR
jgi:hypothetical protein